MKSKDPAERAAEPPSGEQPIRAAEVVGALSLATDLGTGQPLEHALRTAALAVRLGELAGASAQELADTYHVALLHSAGCTSDGHEAALAYGDDIVPRAEFALVDSGDLEEVVAFLKANVGGGRPAPQRDAMVQDALAHGLPGVRQTFASGSVANASSSSSRSRGVLMREDEDFVRFRTDRCWTVEERASDLLWVGPFVTCGYSRKGSPSAQVREF